MMALRQLFTTTRLTAVVLMIFLLMAQGTVSLLMVAAIFMFKLLIFFMQNASVSVSHNAIVDLRLCHHEMASGISQKLLELAAAKFTTR